ncbi:hypothetical protein Hanom_Chr15g01395701 [Helianthus anomalus]
MCGMGSVFPRVSWGLADAILSHADASEDLGSVSGLPKTYEVARLGVVVLWTPQKEDDSLTAKEMFEDYPQLHPF